MASEIDWERQIKRLKAMLNEKPNNAAKPKHQVN